MSYNKINRSDLNVQVAYYNFLQYPMSKELDIQKLNKIKISDLYTETTGCTFIIPTQLIYPLKNVIELQGMNILSEDQIMDFMEYKNDRIRCINKSCQTEKYDENSIECDDCHKEINCYEPRYSNIEVSYTDYCLDFHEQCFKQMTTSEIEKLQKSYVCVINKDICWNNFGSLFDWIPVYVSNMFDAIYICGNKDNPLFGKLALSVCDGHGRRGISVIDLSYQDLIGKYKKLEQINYDTNEEYNSPIEQIMVELNLCIYHG